MAQLKRPPLDKLRSMIPRRLLQVKDRILLVVGLALAGLALTRFIISGIFSPSGIIWVDQFLSPLIELIVDKQPITAIGPRQYGVTSFLIMDPIIRFFGRNRTVIDLWAVSVSMLFIVAAYLLMAHRYFPSNNTHQVFLFAVWLGFLPNVYATALRHIDTWQLFFVASSLFLFTSVKPVRFLSGVPLAAGYLAKHLPIIILVYLFFRKWSLAVVGLLSIVLLLAVGQILYGPLMGFLYPFVILQQTPGLTTYFSTYHENNSVRGLLFKIFAGFKLCTRNSVCPAFANELNILAYVFEAAIFGYLIYAAIRGRHDDSLERKSLEFALATVTMLMIAPQTSHEHMPVMIVAYTILGFFWLKRRDIIPWPSWLVGLAAIGFVLVGVFVPVSTIARILFVEQLMNAAGNGSAIIYGANIGSYDFLGFPGFGMVITWVVLVVLERRWRPGTYPQQKI